MIRRTVVLIVRVQVVDNFTHPVKGEIIWVNCENATIIHVVLVTRVLSVKDAGRAEKPITYICPHRLKRYIGERVVRDDIRNLDKV